MRAMVWVVISIGMTTGRNAVLLLVVRERTIEDGQMAAIECLGLSSSLRCACCSAMSIMRA